jgi:tight adherence protein B
MLLLIAAVFGIAFLAAFGILYVVTAGKAAGAKRTIERLGELAMVSPASQNTVAVDILRDDVLSDIGWLNELLHSFNVFSVLGKMLRQADLEWKPVMVFLVSAVLFTAGGLLVYLRTGVTVVSVALGALLALTPWLYVLHRRKKRFQEFEEKLPEALDLMVSAIRAGHGFASAMSLAARETSEPIAGELKQCFDEQNFGLDLRLAMTNLSERMPIPDVQLLVAAVLIQKESGGNLAEILEKAAYIIRERFRLKRQVRVHTAQGRLTGWILAFMPVILGLLLYLLDPERMIVLWSRPIGVKLLWTAVVMDLIGALIIRKIVRTRI